jgi:hypothetical protein
MASESLSPEVAYAFSGAIVGGIITGTSATYTPNSFVPLVGGSAAVGTAAVNRLKDSGSVTAVTLATSTPQAVDA